MATIQPCSLGVPVWQLWFTQLREALLVRWKDKCCLPLVKLSSNIWTPHAPMASVLASKVYHVMGSVATSQGCHLGHTGWYLDPKSFFGKKGSRRWGLSWEWGLELGCELVIWDTLLEIWSVLREEIIWKRQSNAFWLMWNGYHFKTAINYFYNRCFSTIHL